jgi:PAS domain S-box-containing protein
MSKTLAKSGDLAADQVDFHIAGISRLGPDLYRDVLDALPCAVYITDVEGRITYFNKAAADLWGVEPEIGKSEFCGSWRLYWPDGRPLPHDECPMALALKEKRPNRGMEAVAERPDGIRVPFIAYPTPLYDFAGEMTGAVNMLVDITDRKRAELNSQRLVAIVENSDDAIISKDLNGIITSWNAGAERLFGYTAEEAVGEPVTMLIPPEHLDDEPTIIERIRRGDRIDHYETVRRRKDGSLVDISLSVSPIRSLDGRIVGASKIARDITATKENERRIRLLMREVNHRVKNQFAVILSVVQETSRRATDPREFEEQLRDRIMALSRSHDLLVTSEWSGASLLDLLQEHLKPFGHDQQISLSGPLVTLQPNAVQHLGMAFHELGTNSSKYGALASGVGRITIDWQIVTSAESRREFQVVWDEVFTAPPNAVTTPAEPRKGFGSVVLQRVTPQSLSGAAVVERAPGHVRWSLAAPVESTLVLPLNEHGVVPTKAEVPAPA